MTDISQDSTLLSVETTVDTASAEDTFSNLLTKMQGQSAETVAYLKELGTVLKDLVEAVVEKGGKAEKIVDNATASVQKQQQTIQQQLGKIRDETQLQLANVEKLYEEYGIKATGSLEQAAKNIDTAIRKVKEDAVKGVLKGEEAKGLLSELEQDAKAIYDRLEEQKKKGVKQIIGDKIGEKAEGAVGDVGKATEGLMEHFTSAIPGGALGGGLIGLFLYGMGSIETIRAQAASVSQVFRSSIDQTAGDIVGSVAAVGGEMDTAAKKMHVASEELGSVYTMLGNAGLKADQAGFSVKQMSGAFEGTQLTAAGLHDNLGLLTIAADKAFNLQTGTTARDAVKLSQDLGMSVEHAADQMIKLRMAAQGSGENIDRYMNSVMVASKSMSQFGIDLGTTTALMEAFRAEDTKTGGAQAARAIQGVGQMMQNISGNTGMAAFMAEQIVKKEGGIGEYKAKTGEAIDPLEARRQMLLGFGQEGEGRQKILGDVIGQVQEMARAQGGTKAQQEFMIEKVFNVDTVTAAMINGLKQSQLEDIKKGGKGGLEGKDLEKLAAGFENSKDRENAFHELIKQAINMIVGLMQGLIYGVAGITAYLAQMVGVGSKEQAVATLTMAGNKIQSAIGGFGEGLEGLGRVGEGLGLTKPETHIEKEEREKKEKASKGYMTAGRFGRMGLAPSEEVSKEHQAAAAAQLTLSHEANERTKHGQSHAQTPGGAGHAPIGGGAAPHAIGASTTHYDSASGSIKVVTEAHIGPETLATMQRDQANKRGTR